MNAFMGDSLTWVASWAQQTCSSFTQAVRVPCFSVGRHTQCEENQQDVECGRSRYTGAIFHAKLPFPFSYVNTCACPIPGTTSQDYSVANVNGGNMRTITAKHVKRSIPGIEQFAELVTIGTPKTKRVPIAKRFRSASEADPTMYSMLVEYGFIDKDNRAH